jgi:hypothetical protein
MHVLKGASYFISFNYTEPGVYKKLNNPQNQFDLLYVFISY